MKRVCSLHWVEAKAIVRDLEAADHTDNCFDGFLKKMREVYKDAKTSRITITVETETDGHQTA